MKTHSTIGAKLLRFAVAVAFAVTTIGSASAATIEFDQAGLSGGLLNYAGGIGSTLTGTDIVFGSVTVTGTSADGTYTCQNCFLNFETAGSTGEVGAAGPFPAVVSFDAGGTFVLTGTILDGALNPINVASNIILTGTFAGTPLLADVGSSVQFIASGIDTKNEEFLSYLGVTVNEFIYENNEISAAGDFGTGFSLTDVAVNDADLTNTSVPEPSTMLLSGAALLALGFFRRRSVKMKA